ncbi:Hypothetical_protein [Hexamita inflata]|uniref:Hypothetical_protein n=1 Tax=Hexamita inflata TaxID=28002 RepID=A0AA86QKC2_9EUKA|nr:Hypothetical protein HINF_LOCUS48771 [Hexamita inflata]
MINMLSSILLKSLTNSFSDQVCRNSINVNNQNFVYCIKALNVNQKKLSGSLLLPQTDSQVFLSTDSVRNSKLNIALQETNIFSVFGFSKSLELDNCQINVTIEFKVVEAALICQKCNLKSTDSSFVFIANGNRISGLVLNSENEINLLRTQLQFRINGLEQGGIVHKIPKQVNILLADVNVTGRFSDNNIITGNIVVHILDFTTITLTNFYICTNSASNYASIKEISNWNLVGIINIACQTICNSMHFTYGLCLPDLKNGQLVNNQLICPNDFNFVIDSCQCKQDFVLNGTVCVSILQQLQDLNSNSTVLNTSILLNFSKLNYYQDSNISLSASQLITSINTINTSTQNNFQVSYSSFTNQLQILNTLINKFQQQYDNMIQVNYSIFKNDLDKQINDSKAKIKQSNTSIFSNITTNQSGFDQLLSNNSSLLEDQLTDIQDQLSDSIYNTKSDMQDKIYNAKKILNREIARIKCIHGDCQNINNVIITGIFETAYCSFSSEASHACDVFETYRTKTVPGTCKVKYNPGTSKYDLYTYCCSPQGYWDEDTETCEHITYI